MASNKLSSEPKLDTRRFSGLPLFTHLLVVGLHPDDAHANPQLSNTYHSFTWKSDRGSTRHINGHFTPRILWSYPPLDPRLNRGQIPDFCFPDGVSAKCIRRTDSGSAINQVLYGQSYRTNPTQLHVFFMGGEEDRRLYGLCISKMEFVDSLPSFIHAPKGAPQKTIPKGIFSSGSSISTSKSFFSASEPISNRMKCHVIAPRCYCLLTYFPSFRLHFELLFSLLGQEQLGRLQVMEEDEAEERRQVEARSKAEQERRRQSEDSRQSAGGPNSYQSPFASHLQEPNPAMFRPASVPDLQSVTSTSQPVPPSRSLSPQSARGPHLLPALDPPTPDRSHLPVRSSGENGPVRSRSASSERSFPAQASENNANEGKKSASGDEEGKEGGHRRASSVGFFSWFSDASKWGDKSSPSTTKSPGGIASRALKKGGSQIEENIHASQSKRVPRNLSFEENKNIKPDGIIIDEGSAQELPPYVSSQIPNGEEGQGDESSPPKITISEPEGTVSKLEEKSEKTLSEPAPGVEKVEVPESENERAASPEASEGVASEDPPISSSVEVAKEKEKEMMTVEQVVENIVETSIQSALQGLNSEKDSSPRESLGYFSPLTLTSPSPSPTPSSSHPPSSSGLSSSSPASSSSSPPPSPPRSPATDPRPASPTDDQETLAPPTESPPPSPPSSPIISFVQNIVSQVTGGDNSEEDSTPPPPPRRHLSPNSSRGSGPKSPPTSPTSSSSSSSSSSLVTPKKEEEKTRVLGFNIPIFGKKEEDVNPIDGTQNDQKNDKTVQVSGSSKQNKSGKGEGKGDEEGEEEKVEEAPIRVDEVRLMLEAYFRTTVSPNTSSFELEMPRGVSSLNFRCPRLRPDILASLGVEGAMVTDWCLLTTIRALSVPSLLAIFSAALLEKPILFVCPNLWLLTCVVLSVSALIRPLTWQGIQAPVLPVRMQDLLDAPVPFLFGVQSFPEKRKVLGTSWDKNTWDGVMVDISNNVVINKTNSLGSLPEGKKLEAKLLSKCGDMYSPHQLYHPSSISSKEMEVVNEVLVCFLQYTGWFSDAISSSFLTSFRTTFGANYSPSSVRDSPSSSTFDDAQHKEYKEKKKLAIMNFLRKIAYQNRPFVSNFINTQMFADYLEKKLKK